MTATETRLSCHLLRKFSAETRPPPILRRDERIRSMASSFEEIIESEEEDVQIPPMSCSSSAGRSPYAVQSESPFSQRRSNSLTNNPLISPKFAKRNATPRLMRGFSDPMMRRKTSLPSLMNMHSPEKSSSEQLSSELLSLPPIPEAATPASPSSNPPALFRENNEE